MRVVNGGKVKTAEDGSKGDLDLKQTSARSPARRPGTNSSPHPDIRVRIRHDVKSTAALSRVTLEIRDAHAHRRLALPGTAEGVRQSSRPRATSSSVRYLPSRDSIRSSVAAAVSARRIKPTVYINGRQQRNSVESSESSESDSTSPRIFYNRGRCVSAISHVNTADWLQVGGVDSDRSSASARHLPHVDRYNRPVYWNSMEPSFYMSSMGRRSQRSKSVASMLVDIHGARREDYQWARSRSQSTFAWHVTSKTRSTTCVHTRKGAAEGRKTIQAETVLVPSASDTPFRRPSSGVRTAFSSSNSTDETDDNRYNTYSVDVHRTEHNKTADYWITGETQATDMNAAGNSILATTGDDVIMRASAMIQHTGNADIDESLQLVYSDLFHLNTADDDEGYSEQLLPLSSIGDKSTACMSETPSISDDAAGRRQAAALRHPSHIKLKRAQSARNILHTHQEVDEETEADSSRHQDDEELTANGGFHVGGRRPVTAIASTRHPHSRMVTRHSQNDLTRLATIDLRGKTAREALDIPRLCLESPPPPAGDHPDDWQQQPQPLQLVVPQLRNETSPGSRLIGSATSGNDSDQLSQGVTSLQLNMRNAQSPVAAAGNAASGGGGERGGGRGGGGGQARVTRSDSARLLIPKLQLDDDSPPRHSAAADTGDDVIDGGVSPAAPSWRMNSPPPLPVPTLAADSGDTDELDSEVTDKSFLNIPTIQFTPDQI